MIVQYGCRAWLVILMLAIPPASGARVAHDAPRSESGAIQPASESDPKQLEPITVLGTRTARTPDEIPRSIDVIGQGQIAHQQSTTLADAVDMLPNVSVTNGPRPVAREIRIRGLTGRHILLLIDGIRQDYDVGHMGTGFISPGLIESVAIQRGPAAVLWGGGALGGVISVNTKEAADLLPGDQAIGAHLEVGYQSVSDAWAVRGAVYGHLGESVDALVVAGRRDNDNLELANGNTLAHSAYDRTSVLAKSTVDLAPGSSLRFSHRRLRLTGVSPGAPGGTGSSLEDRETVVGASRVEWQFLPPGLKLVDLTVGLSHIRTEVDEREIGAHQHDNTVIAGFGIDVANTSRLDLGTAGRHVLTYGFDVNRKRIEATRNGHPRPSTPDGTRLLAGVFVQDEIHWNEAWTAILGLRFDHFHSESETGVAPDKDASEVSTQIGLLWQATNWLQLYASYAEAFRAPSVGEMYIGGRHSFGGGAYAEFVPNPDLKPERAANKEIGIRTEWHGVFAGGDRLRFDVTFFRNDVDNYIEAYMTLVVPPGPPPPMAPAFEIGYRNASEVRLEGFEAVATYTADAWFAGVSYGRVRGTNLTKDRPLAGIPADTWVFSAGLTALPWNGRITWRTTYAAGQHRVPPGGRPTDSYTVHDLLTSWHPTRDLRLDFGIGNVTDNDYRRVNSAIRAPGRNIKISVTYKF